MKNYQIEDFTIGENVFHKSKPSLLMIVKEINKEIYCTWIDSSGEYKGAEFEPQELGKPGDVDPKVTSVPFRR